MVSDILRISAAAVVLLAASCAQRHAADAPGDTAYAPPRPAGEELQLGDCPFFGLLSFEHEHDLLFVRCEGAVARRDAVEARSGRASLLLPPGTRSMTVNLAALHSGRPFPDRWTLLGAWFRCDRAQRLTALCEADGQTLASATVDVPAGRWCPVMLDLAEVAGRQLSDPGVIRFVFEGGLSAPARCDDVVEIDNLAVAVDIGPGSPWSVRLAGFRYFLERPGMFRIVLKSRQAAPNGWTLVEANPIRAVFASTGPEKNRIIYSDGRQFIDGRFEAIGPTRQLLQRQHSRPAEVHIENESGRLLRNEPGDGDNDGYVETTGVYRIAAAAPRLHLVVIPRTEELLNAVLQIDNLPPGRIIATMEGRMAERAVRLDNGAVLLELTGRLRSPTTVVVRVERDL